MNKPDAALVERYQLMHQQDPSSRVFAPLTDCYRKMGLLDEALHVAKQGLQHHPQFAGGRIALARVLMAQGKEQEASTHLLQAVATEPENLLAHSLLADLLLKLKQPKAALKSFKMLLLLNPDNERAKKAVRRLESLTADEYDDEVFAMKPLADAMDDVFGSDLDFSELSQSQPQNESDVKTLERFISLADAFIVRNDFDRAIESLSEAERLLGRQPDIEKRLRIIRRQQERPSTPEEPEKLTPMIDRKIVEIDEQIDCLRELLRHVTQDQYRKDPQP